MRRRLSRQRRVREALLLDLGALVYELHRQGKRAPELLQEKAGELTLVDEEVRGLEEALGDGAGLDRLMATGIVGSCASCGALLNAGDGYCTRCGAPAQVRAAEPGEWAAEAKTGEYEAGAGPAGPVGEPEDGDEAATAGAGHGEAGESGAGEGEAERGAAGDAPQEPRPGDDEGSRP